ncbi:MAG TPA: type I-U CRISPR-associated protein Cas8c [Humisphaera sp.]|jgi:CRISPR-associated protein Csb3|nr:type I-U CRISPR-associated protein Cas8c [Humisphaera sp.]
MIRIPVDLTNPGQFFACCGLLELADRLSPAADGWFEGKEFHLQVNSSFGALADAIRQFTVTNTMSAALKARLEELSLISKKDREKAGVEEEKKVLDGLRREEPIVFQSSFSLRVDWFRDEYAGGSRFKTWAGQQSVLDIAMAMHAGLNRIDVVSESALWASTRGIGLPFNFDSDLGGQGSALDIGFSFDPLAASETTRIEGACRPALELLAFIGLQRFRPRQVTGQNRFVYAVWQRPLPPCVAAAAACQAIATGDDPSYEFRLLYRTKYLKSFLPAIPFQGDDHE